MSYSLVTEAEFCWVLEWVEPAETTALAEHLPTSTKAAYMRLRRFEGAYVTRTTTGAKSDQWSLTEAGHEIAAAADLPPIEEVDLSEYFAGRSTSINPAAILHEIGINDAEWVPSSVLYDALPYAKSTLRKRLNKLSKAGALDRDATKRTNRWRLTEEGREQLSKADNYDPRDESARIYESRPV